MDHACSSGNLSWYVREEVCRIDTCLVAARVMTAPRRKIEASLAERGRPAMWANEQEAAALSGVGVQTFRQKVSAWERRGFPPINPENGRRSIPAVLAFWGLPQNPFDLDANNKPIPEESIDDDGKENWNE